MELAPKHSSQPCHEPTWVRAESNLSTDRYPTVFLLYQCNHMYTIDSLLQRICASIQPAAAVFRTGPTWNGWPVHAGQPPKQTKSLSHTHEDASAMRPRCCAVYAVLLAALGRPQCHPPSPPTEETVLPLFPARQLDVPYTSVKFFAGKD